LEIADIFQKYGPAWRQANKGHVSLSQLKVMSSIEACRTEVLGGHVAACTKCNHQHIAYNSCKIPLTGRRFGKAKSAERGALP
jgi:hypothetical protein